MKLPDENKQTIFKSYIAKTESTNFEEQADLYIRKIDSLADIFDRLKKEDSSCITHETVNDKLKHNEILEGLKNRSIDLINLENNIKVVDVLKLVLRTRPIRFDYLFIYFYSCIQLRAKFICFSFVSDFLDLNGLDKLLNLIINLKSKWRYDKLHYDLICCIKAILNTSVIKLKTKAPKN